MKKGYKPHKSWSKQYRKHDRLLSKIDRLIKFEGWPHMLLECPRELNPNFIVPHSDNRPISFFNDVNMAYTILRNKIKLDRRFNKSFYHRNYYSRAWDDSVEYFSMLYLYITKCFPYSCRTALQLYDEIVPFFVRKRDDTIYIGDIKNSITYIEKSGYTQQIQKGIESFYRLDIQSQYYEKIPSSQKVIDNKKYYSYIDGFFIERSSENEYITYLNLSRITSDDEGVCVTDENTYDVSITWRLTGKELSFLLKEVVTIADVDSIIKLVPKYSLIYIKNN